MAVEKRILIYGYGNPGRQDDGLGKALADEAETWIGEQQLDNVSVEVAFQLQVEDVLKMVDVDLVLFVDASMDEQIGDFTIERVISDPEASFSAHSVPPGFIVGLYEALYGPPPLSYLIQIRGYEWELEESVTSQARQNMELAWGLVKKILMDPDRLEMLSNAAEIERNGSKK
jgi:hydrogenase maturation protease